MQSSMDAKKLIRVVSNEFFEVPSVRMMRDRPKHLETVFLCTTVG